MDLRIPLLAKSNLNKYYADMISGDCCQTELVCEEYRFVNTDRLPVDAYVTCNIFLYYILA